jgi:omega-amidase
VILLPVLFYFNPVEKMKLSVIQPDTAWEDKNKNFRIIWELSSGLENDTDIIILPEMFNTGFSMNPEELSESARSETFDWMINLAESRNCAVCGSYIVKDKNRFFNRWTFVTPEKKSWFYDKRHLFRPGNEHDLFSPGKKRLALIFRGVRISPNICYDLRFPVWSRNVNNYDLLINSANWPAARREVWITLLKARAIENQCYVAGANRIGTDGAGVKYAGDSMIIGPRGEIMASADRNRECSISAEISIPELKGFRKKFPVLKDKDKFIIA